MSNLAPGDLIEVVYAPPPGHWQRVVCAHGHEYIGLQGVVMSGPFMMPRERQYPHCKLEFHDVRLSTHSCTLEAILLRKIQPPPLDVDEPTEEELTV